MCELYPLKFQPIFIEKLWGGSKIEKILNKNAFLSDKIGESWEISDLKDNISVVNNGKLKGHNLKQVIDLYKSDLLGKRIFKKYGSEFPLLIKFIDANKDLSVQVHPDDFYAEKYYKMKGKNEVWYIIDADSDSKIITGFNKDTDIKEFKEKLSNNQLDDILNFEKVEKGDFFKIPSKRIHAIGTGILLAEIQQSSNITFRVFDWDRIDLNGKKRELHIEEALNNLDFEKYTNNDIKTSDFENSINCLCKKDFFTTNILVFDDIFERNYSNIDSFVIFICVEGNCTLHFDKKTEELKYGETILLPSIFKNISFSTQNQARILETYIE